MRGYEWLIKYKTKIIILFLILILGMILWLLRLEKQQDLLYIENDHYSFQYDRNWKIVKQSDEKVILRHSSNSQIVIEMISLEEEDRYKEVSDFIDELLYYMEDQNKDYQLLFKEEQNITKNQYSGYRILFEKEDEQVMVNVCKKSDQLILFTYEASFEYFDILLDSVHNIIYHFDTISEKFDLSTEIDLKTSEISFSPNEVISSQLKDMKSFEIAYDHYYVNYSIPSNFKETALNSITNSFEYENLEEGSLKMNVRILNRNIYEYLDKENSSNIYKEYKIYSENEDYSDFTEAIDQWNSDYESFIYKNSYQYNKSLSFNNFEKEYKSVIQENVVLLYALNNNHILRIEISSSELQIPEELIQKIQINEVKNYASYIKLQKEEGNLIGTLKRFKDYTKTEVEEITLKVPSKYQEFEKNGNIYEKRYYGLNYDEEEEIYQYEITYERTGTYTKIDQYIDNMNKNFIITTYGSYQNLAYSGEIVKNDKKFIDYTGGFTQIGGIMFTDMNRRRYYVHTKVLFFELSTGGYLVIRIEGNGIEISDEIINDVTNFDIEEK